MAFEQAAIKVEKADEFGKLQAAIKQAFSPEKVERFLKQMERQGLRVRDFDGLLAKGVLESVAGSAAGAQQLYEALALSDQAQIRELYLSKLESVDVALRHKFKKLYQYY
jgi:hypothetical protein